MKKLLILIFILCLSNLSYGQIKSKSVNTRVTVQQYEDGKLDDSRFFIYYFESGDGYCDVISVSVNNQSCSKNSSLGPDNGFWIKPEFSNKGSHGEKFQCKLSKISNERYEFVIEEPISSSGKFIHRIVLQDNPIQLTEMLDYSGVLTKYSEITKKTETVTYKPITKKTYSNWDSFKLGCNTMSIPVIKK